MRGSLRESICHPVTVLAEAPPHPDFPLRVKSGLSPHAGRGERRTLTLFSPLFKTVLNTHKQEDDANA